MNQETTIGTKSNRTKIIKRYQNRKLYDTQQSCYVTLDDIAKMIRNSEEVMVIDNKTKNDITAATLTQIIFEAEKKASQAGASIWWARLEYEYEMFEQYAVR